MRSTSTSRTDVYEAITNQIISAIEAGAGSGKVQLPWHRSGASITRPVNIASKNPYRGVNTIALWAPPMHTATRTASGAPTRQWAGARGPGPQG
jgi:antirestriction protein ArdC